MRLARLLVVSICLASASCASSSKLGKPCNFDSECGRNERCSGRVCVEAVEPDGATSMDSGGATPDGGGPATDTGAADGGGASADATEPDAQAVADAGSPDGGGHMPDTGPGVCPDIMGRYSVASSGTGAGCASANGSLVRAVQPDAANPCAVEFRSFLGALAGAGTLSPSGALVVPSASISTASGYMCEGEVRADGTIELACSLGDGTCDLVLTRAAL